MSRIATAIVLVVSFLDSQLTYCSMQAVTKPRKKKLLRGSHEQVSDIEYIIPRVRFFCQLLSRGCFYFEIWNLKETAYLHVGVRRFAR